MSAVRDRATGRFTRSQASPSQAAEARPSRVVAGGLVWRAEEDDQPYAAVIGWEIAVRLGQAGPADRGRG